MAGVARSATDVVGTLDGISFPRAVINVISAVESWPAHNTSAPPTTAKEIRATAMPALRRKLHKGRKYSNSGCDWCARDTTISFGRPQRLGL